MWGQHFTDAVWEGVLGGLRAAPPQLLGGAAGKAAGIPKLLETFLNLVAVQVRGCVRFFIFFICRDRPNWLY